MKAVVSKKTDAFTLSEMMIAMAITTIIVAATVTASVALQKSFSAVDKYFATHMQQIRIVGYIARDVKRGLSVTSSVDHQTIVIQIPKYIIQAGDPENPSRIGTPRDPTLSLTDKKINYGASTNEVVYKVIGSSILRTENGVVTTIASSTDNLVPETIDIELANTEFTTTAITFKPISMADKNGTVVYSTAYLRNRRR